MTYFVKKPNSTTPKDNTITKTNNNYFFRKKNQTILGRVLSWVRVNAPWIRNARFIRWIGLKTYIHYCSKAKGTQITINLNGISLTLRCGTQDLSVAISCICIAEFEVTRNLLPSEYNGVIIDAGGYIGTAAIAFTKLYPNAQIITIEPSLENIKVLEKNIQKFKNIKLVHSALIAGNEQKILLKDPGSDQWGFTIVKNPYGKECLTLHETPAVNLSSLGVDTENIGILKLDIEGGELDLFKNDSINLSKIKNIIVELHDRIIDGCEEAFFNFSKDRIIIKDEGEKFLSIKK